MLPAICGAAMLVPLLDTKSDCPDSSHLLLHDIIEVPGAHISGFILPSPVGPLLLEYAIESSERLSVFLSSILPTVITLYADPGSPTVVEDGPSFPALIATGVFKSKTTASM